MKTIELELDDKTFEQVRQLAEARRYTLEAFIVEIIERLALIGKKPDPLLGMFADEPEMIDQVIESVMAAREMYALC